MTVEYHPHNLVRSVGVIIYWYMYLHHQTSQPGPLCVRANA